MLWTSIWQEEEQENFSEAWHSLLSTMMAVKGATTWGSSPLSLLAHISQDRKQRWDRKQGWTINFKEQIPLLRIHFLKKPHLPKQNNQIVVIYSNTLVNGRFQISHYIMLPMTFIGLMSLLLFLDQNVLSAHNQKFP